MPKIIPILISLLVISGGSASADVAGFQPSQFLEAQTEISRQYIRGPRGGCYYINSNGNKTYVDRSRCRGQ